MAKMIDAQGAFHDDDGRYAEKPSRAAAAGTISVSRQTTIYATVKTEDGDEVTFESDFEPDGLISPAIESLEDGGHRITYAVQEGSPAEPGLMKGDRLMELSSDEAWELSPAEIAQRYHVAPEQAVFARRIDHGAQVEYEVLGTAADADEWGEETSPRNATHLLAVDTEGVQGVTDFTGAAEGVFAERTAWANGDVYGVVTVQVDENGDVVEHEEDVWGYYGSEAAEEEIKWRHRPQQEGKA